MLHTNLLTYNNFQIATFASDTILFFLYVQFSYFVDYG